MACATPSVPRTCCFDAREISCTSSADCRTTLEIAYQRAARLNGQRCPGLHFLRAFFHDHHGFVRLRLDGLDQCGDVFVALQGVFRQLADFVEPMNSNTRGRV